MNPRDMRIDCADAFDWLPGLDGNSVDLVLTDPPYGISRDTGFAATGKNSVERFAVSMDFGEWDRQPLDLRGMSRELYRVLRKGGTAIVFYDIWKLTWLAKAMTEAGFAQLRLIHWEKSNPVPLNSSVNYLTNSREIAVTGVKGGKSTFNSAYDRGVYSFPIPHSKDRFHPNQKPLDLFKQLILKHSRRGDTVCDPFSGSGTAAKAAYTAGRQFVGCEKVSWYAEAANVHLRELMQ